MPDRPADAAQIQALLTELSRVRLAVSADLSAAAGALDDNRPDVASDMVAGARRELAELLEPARRPLPIPSPSPRLVTAGAGAERDSEPAAATSRGGFRPRLVRALAGAAALAVAIGVVPQLAGSSSHHSTGATAAAPSPTMRLASSEFTVLSQQLTAADATPAAILAAGRTWQTAVSRDLPSAATTASSAAAVVTMLRLERTLLHVSPTLRVPQNRTVATTLTAASNDLLAQLRRLANPQVLAALPAVIQALPLSTPSKPAAGKVGAASSPATTSSSSANTPSQQPSVPSTGQTIPTVPQAPTGPAPAPSPGTGLPLPPLPSTLGQLTGGGTQGGGLGQTVGDVLNGLGLGG